MGHYQKCVVPSAAALGGCLILVMPVHRPYLPHNEQERESIPWQQMENRIQRRRRRRRRPRILFLGIYTWSARCTTRSMLSASTDLARCAHKIRKHSNWILDYENLVAANDTHCRIILWRFLGTSAEEASNCSCAPFHIYSISRPRFPVSKLKYTGPIRFHLSLQFCHVQLFPSLSLLEPGSGSRILWWPILMLLLLLLLLGCCLSVQNWAWLSFKLLIMTLLYKS